MSKLYAKIITDNTNINLDRPFTYEIPKEFKSIAKKGIRVLVPFGKGNRLIEGLIIGIKESLTEEENMYRIKMIEYFLEKEPSLNEKQLELLEWIREEYICRYIDVIRTMIPRGLNLRINKYIILKQKIDQDKELYSYLNEKKKVSLKYLEKKFGKEIVKREVNYLLDKGNISIEEDYEQKANKKYIKRVYKKFDEIEDALYLLPKRANKQREIIRFLANQEDGLILDEIRKKISINNSSIKALVEKKFIEIREEEIYRDILNRNIKDYKKHSLNYEQREVFDKFIESDQRYFLLKGVTGSGKTEIYLQLIEKNLKEDKNAIVLVPEISLTPQMMDRFIGRFGNKVAVYHSKLSISERYDEWRKMKNGDVNIVIGTRSAIFAPFKDIGIIIIDEEHENTYKSETNPRYDSIELAKKMAEIYDCKLLLGSATPSINDYFMVVNKDMKLLELKNRVSNICMPDVEIVDMREELDSGNTSIFSKKLFKEISNRLKRKEQSILFLNSRGFAKAVKCRKCGYVVECDNCDISMTLHGDKNRLLCHYCGETKRIPRLCPECQSKYIRSMGIGTQRVEIEVKKAFPSARVIRMDTDTMQRKNSYEEALRKIERNEVDILIGTQMISKGLDYPNITLVGIIMADISLNIPDFSSAEKTFQLITQVSGRAGRSDKKGEVIVQTYEPENYAIKASIEADYNRFFYDEIRLRQSYRYPPYCELIDITVSGEDEDKSFRIARNLSNNLKTAYLNDSNSEDINISNANNASIYRVRNRYRFKILIKYDKKNKKRIKEIVRKYCIDDELNKNSDIIISVDVNPRFIL
ncbi:MAG: primosomal protein N' [Andreesenia angusta]|nr:primosomal protein N' [Andreesenia angusta]